MYPLISTLVISQLALAAPLTVEDKIEFYARKYDVSPHVLHAVVDCESGLDPQVQSHIVKNGKREDSWGLAQFHLPSKNTTPQGKTITKKMALDPDIALDAMAWHFSEGRAKRWSCYKQGLYIKHLKGSVDIVEIPQRNV